MPKTIDNDLSATDFTFGFHTAVQIATDAIDRLHTTAESHDRVMVVEVMGRHAGWIATSGLAGGADIILVPEEPFDIDEVCSRIKHRHRRGASFSIVVVAEGAPRRRARWSSQSGEVDEFGHVRLGGIGNQVADEIERRTGFETRTRSSVTCCAAAHRRRTTASRDALRDRGDRRGARRRVRCDGRAARHRHRAGPDRSGVEQAQDRRPKLYDTAAVFFG